MQKSAIILALFIFLQILSACSQNSHEINTSNSAASNANAANAAKTANDNIEELGMIVKLPFEPDEVAWKEIPTENGRILTAVLRFSGENASKIVSQATRIRPASPAILTAEIWYPSELISQSEIDGDSNLRAATYAADDFLQPPYAEGRISRVENTDYFILELNAK